MTPEELEAGLAASQAAAAHLRGEEGAPVYPVPPDPPIARRGKDDDDDDTPARRRR
jgi:hypothetical protein